METQKEYNPSILLEIKTDGNRIPIGQKWQEKTRGGHVDIKEVKQIGDRLAIFGLRNDVDLPNDNLVYWFCNLDGINIGDNNYFDLIPYNPLLTTLEKELEEVRLKEKQLLEKIKELKTK